MLVELVVLGAMFWPTASSSSGRSPTAGGLLGILAVALRYASSAVSGTVAQFAAIGIALALQGLILAVGGVRVSGVTEC